MDGEASKFCCINFSLTDDLLVEIFCRLPCAESVIQCKCVCKHWLSLISQPEFAARFSTHKINCPSGSHIQGCNQNAIFYPSRLSFTTLESSLSFMPNYEKEATCPIIVRARSNDLILCSNPPPKELDFYICNPRTKQWLQLPPPSSQQRSLLLAGFTYDPYYVFDEETASVTMSTSSRYSVYCVLYSGSPMTELKMEIYSSDIGVWKKAVLSLTRCVNFIYTNKEYCFTYNRMLHIYIRDAIIGFDPYNISEDGVIHGHCIQMPQYDAFKVYCKQYVGVFGDHILLVQFCECKDVDIAQANIEPKKFVNSLKVWELKDYDTGEWSLKRMVHLHDLVSNDFELVGFRWKLREFFFHPNDADVVYLVLHEQIFECNMREKTWKLLIEIPKFRRFYGLAFPWWPSPLPQNM